MNSESLDAKSIRFDRGTPFSFDGRMPAQANVILRLLERLKHGILRLDLPDGRTLQYGHQGHPVSLRLHNWNLIGAALRSGDIGFAETYIDGDWETDDLPALIELFVRNRDAIESIIYGTWWGSLLHRLRHAFNRNSRKGSRRNIHAHYDIGNDFYRLWLDPSMTYSSALFDNPHANLQEAQKAKYQRMLDELQLPAAAKILEIGCGWGGFAELAAHSGAHVTGLTLSTEQLAYARRRLNDASLGEHAELLLQDYRDIAGQFDGIASIEMFEAVGEQYWPAYFQCISRNLKASGRACIQTIVIDDALFARYRRGTDFIQQYIFPGGMLPSPTAFRDAAARQGLQVVNELAFGIDYARTLQAWRKRFHETLPDVHEQGFDDRFIRTWDFYLAYCEAGFRAGSIGVMQFTLQKS